MATTDPTLAALLADPSPEARAICADWLEERGEEIPSLFYRLLAALPACGGSYNETVNGWHVVITWGSGEYLSVYPYGVATLNGGWFWWVRNRAKKRRGPVLYQWTHWRYNNYRPASATPPPTLEAAVVEVLRRRLVVAA